MLFFGRVGNWIIVPLGFTGLPAESRQARRTAPLYWVMTRKNPALAVPEGTLKLNVPVPVLVVCSGGGLERKTGRRSGERLPA